MKRLSQLIVGSVIAASAVFALAGAASAHDLNGGSAQKTCVPGDGVDVTWSFTSSNAGGFHIVSVTFDRSVLVSSFTANTVMAKTNEVAGTSPSLRATATFDDGFVTSRTVTTTIPTDLCPPPTTTTVPPTTAPPVTEPPTTVPPVTTTTKVCEDGKPPSIPVEDGSLVCPEFGAPPAPPATTTTAAAVTGGAAAPTTVQRQFSGQLPATGGEVPALLALAGLILAIGVPSVIVGRRIDRKRS